MVLFSFGFDWGSVAGSVVGAISSLIGNQINKKNYKDLLDYSSTKNQSYQSWLLNNSAPMQMGAIKSAGVNPALANSSLGSASMPSIGISGVPEIDLSSPMSQMMNAVTQSKVGRQQVKTGIAQEHQAESQADVNSTLAEANKIDNITRGEKNVSEIKKNLADVGVKNSEMVANEIQNEINKKTIAAQVAMKNINVDVFKSQLEKNAAEIAHLNADRIKITEETKWITPQIKQALAESASRVAVNASMQKMNYSQAALNYANEAKSILESYGIDLNNKQFEDVKDYLFNQEYFKSVQEGVKADNLIDFGSSEISDYETKDTNTPFSNYLGGSRTHEQHPRKIPRKLEGNTKYNRWNPQFRNQW